MPSPPAIRNPGGSACDVLVAGGGPAALALTTALAQRGVRVLRVAPERPWGATYCCWADELTEAASSLGLVPGDAGRDQLAALAVLHPQPRVRTRSGGVRDLSVSYARLRGDVLATRLRDRAEQQGAAHRPGAVVQVRSVRGGVEAELADGTCVRAGLAVDATGGRRAAPVQQRAWGEVVEGPSGLLPPGGALFMDWATPLPGGPPVFLYGLDLGDGTELLELTSLAARPPVPLPELRAGLHALLAARGIRLVGRSERVAIPLGRHGAHRRTPALPFGAAAGLVHPATGYSVAASLLLAGPFADRLVAALQPGHRRPWPAGRGPSAVGPAARSTLLMLDRGLETLLPLGRDDLDAFFAAFFRLPERQWRGYLDVRSGPATIAAAMTGTLRELPAHLQAAAVVGTMTAGRLRRRPVRPARHDEPGVS